MSAVPSMQAQIHVARLHALDHEIDRLRRELLELWQNAASTDRILAVDRVLREAMLPPGLAHDLHAMQEAVRDAWVKSRLAQHVHRVDPRRARPADAGLAWLQLKMMERELDAFLASNNLFDLLLTAGETYLHPVPAVGGSATLKSLLAERERERARRFPILPPIEDAVATG
jgi:hypothetical protein